MRAFGVVERHPVADHSPGLEAVGDFFEIDHLLHERAPQPPDHLLAERVVFILRLHHPRDQYLRICLATLER